jgi:hypothetical protein
MTQKKWLNLGCGRVILPAEKPAHHALIPDGIHSYALWHNVDVVQSDGVDEVLDIFRYPFPWADNSYDGALLTHLVEHVPHEIRIEKRSTVDPATFVDIDTWIPDAIKVFAREEQLSRLPDGFYAFFSELHRVLTPDACAHIIVPYAFSTGAMQDPDHKRYLVPNSFTYLQPNPDAPFLLPDGGAWSIDEVRYGVTEYGATYANDPAMMERALATMNNIASEFYVKLRVIKPAEGMP